nr:MAG TPA: hypothetical protein [Caudoviricetes sp.]
MVLADPLYKHNTIQTNLSIFPLSHSQEILHIKHYKLYHKH